MLSTLISAEISCTRGTESFASKQNKTKQNKTKRIDKQEKKSNKITKGQKSAPCEDRTHDLQISDADYETDALPTALTRQLISCPASWIFAILLTLPL